MFAALISFGFLCSIAMFIIIYVSSDDNERRK